MSQGIIEIHPRVEDPDLVEITASIAQDNPAAARRVLQAVRRAFELVARFPEMGTFYRTEQPKLMGIRMIPVRPFRNYLVFYMPLSGNAGVRILYVLHGARDISELFKKDSR